MAAFARARLLTRPMKMVLGYILAWDEVSGGSPAGWTFDLLGIVLGEKK
jgi:hypothetical protein